MRNGCKKLGVIFEDGDASSGRRAEEEVLEMLFDDDHAPQTTEESNEEDGRKGESVSRALLYTIAHTRVYCKNR